MGKETAVDRQARLRADSLDALRAAAEHLELGPDQLLKAKEFDRACQEIGSDWRSGRVIRIWGSWSHAQGALIGGYVPRSAAERAVRSAASRSRGKSRGDPVRGVRLWLETKPQSETRASYRAFRQSYNEHLDQGEPPLYSEGTLVNDMGLAWATVKDVARGELTLSEALDARSTEPVRIGGKVGELVGGKAAAEILGREFRAFRRHADKRSFPAPAATVGNWRLWRTEDIARYRDGRRDYITQEEGELEGEVLAAQDIRRRLGLSPSQLQYRVRNEQWDEVPKPEGKLGKGHFWWLRSRVEEWERSRGKD